MQKLKALESVFREISNCKNTKMLKIKTLLLKTLVRFPSYSANFMMNQHF